MSVSLNVQFRIGTLVKAEKKSARPQNKIFPTSTPAVFIWESVSPGRLFLSMTENLRKEI